MKRRTAITDYRNGVAYLNAQLAQRFGARQFIVTRGNGYYYFRGDHHHAVRVASIYWGDMALDTAAMRSAVADLLVEKVHEIRAIIDDIHTGS